MKNKVLIFSVAAIVALIGGAIAYRVVPSKKSVYPKTKEVSEIIGKRRLARNKNDRHALYLIGLEASKLEEIPEHRKLAANIIRDAARLGHPDAIYLAGEHALNGFDTAKSTQKALTWFEQAGDAGNIKGYVIAAKIRILGDDKNEAIDFDKAQALLEKAGDEPEALALRGALLIDLHKDYGKAIPLLEKSRGTALAQSIFARLNDKGIYRSTNHAQTSTPGITSVTIDGNKLQASTKPKNEKSAPKADNAKTMLIDAVAILKSSPAPTKKEMDEAKLKAANAFNNGNPLAAYLLASLPGTSDDDAIAWLQKGAKAGNSKCKDAYKKITVAKMTLGQVLPSYKTIINGIGGTSKASPSSIPIAFLDAPLPEIPCVFLGSAMSENVRLSFVITDKGATEEIQVISSSHPLLANASKSAVATWKFQPQIKYGAPASKTVNNFKIEFRVQQAASAGAGI